MNVNVELLIQHGNKVFWADETASVVRISQIETRILNLTGVVDINNTKINGAASNLVLGEYEIPVLGGVSNG